MSETSFELGGPSEFEELNPPDPQPSPDGEQLPGGRFMTGTGQVLHKVHEENPDCIRYHCVIHAPSDHNMRDFPTHWRDDRGIMERICPHGVGHPDPDDQAFITRRRGRDHCEGVHGCCGNTCCAP